MNSFPRHNFCTCKAFKVIAELAEPALPEIFHSHKARSFDHGLVQRILRQLLQVSSEKHLYLSDEKHFMLDCSFRLAKKIGKVFSYRNSAITGCLPTLTF